MPALKNPKHEAFAQAVAAGMPASQAYVEHVSRDGNCSDRTAEVTGSKLQHTSEVSLRISELRKAASDVIDKKWRLNRETWLERLEGLATKAEAAEDFSASAKALTEVGKASGWYEPEKHELTINVTIGGKQYACTATTSDAYGCVVKGVPLYPYQNVSMDVTNGGGSPETIVFNVDTATRPVYAVSLTADPAAGPLLYCNEVTP